MRNVQLGSEGMATRGNLSKREEGRGGMSEEIIDKIHAYIHECLWLRIPALESIHRILHGQIEPQWKPCVCDDVSKGCTCGAVESWQKIEDRYAQLRMIADSKFGSLLLPGTPGVIRTELIKELLAERDALIGEREEIKKIVHNARVDG
jgi:hypothetical protein